MTNSPHATPPSPKVEEADPPDVLDPAKVFETVHVLIEYPGMARNDILTYYWHGPTPSGRTSDWRTVTHVIEGDPVRFAVGG